MKFSQLVFGVVLLVAFPFQRGEVAQAQNDEALKLWDAVSGVVRDIPLQREDVTSLAFSPNNKLLAAGSATKVINLFEPGTGKKIRVLAGHKGAVQTLSFRSDGPVLASGSWDRTIKLWNVATGQQIASFIGNDAEVLSVAFSPTGNHLASGGGDETVRLWNPSTNRIIHLLSGHTKKINSVAFSFDGKYLASGSDDKTIRVWEVETGKLVLTLDGHYGPVESVAFSPHNYTLASSSEDQTIKIWDALTGKELFTLKGHLSSVDYVAFSPNGKSLASGSYDRTVKLWDIDSGTELRALQGHRQRITSLAFAPDGKTLVSASALNRFENPTLHVLAVGITNYRDTVFPVVHFAAKDARDFAAGLEQAARTKFERINVSVLTDYDAGHMRISLAISKLIENAKPQDVFVLFFAGYASMGFDPEVQDDRFGLLPADGHKITDVLLRSWLSQIEARQQFVILETKDTSKGHEFLIKEFANENKVLRGLLKRDLVILVNAFQGTPIPKLKNQFLTNGLLDGLSGRAALETGELTANRLVEYVKNAHAALPKEYLRRAGEITSFTSGQDFQLANFSKPHLRGLFAHVRSTGAATHLEVQGSRRTKRKRPPARPSGKKTRSSSSNENKNQERESTPSQSAYAGGEFKRRGKDYALFIATDKYRNWKRLGNPIRDATAVADMLEKYYDFKTEVVTDPTLDDVTAVLERYINRHYDDGDQLFIFFAGHGHYIRNTRQGYLVFSDSLSKDNDRIGSTYVSYPILSNMIDNIPCKHILLVIDACHSGTFNEAIAKKGPFRGSADVPLPRFIEEKMQYTTRRYITSGGNEPVEDGDIHSPFTVGLLEALRTFGGQAGYLTIATIGVNLQTLTPTPILDKWGQDEPGSEFFFFAKPPETPQSEKPLVVRFRSRSTLMDPYRR